MAGRPRKLDSTGEASALPVDAPEDLPAHHRENPDKLTGEALRALAHRHGLARSTLEGMQDDKIREQLKYLAYRRASE